ncbi:MAG TPA: SgcJ/EcaC family oxidoreductase [Myxococcota bacterium]|nr:SgcJ/EcaC family oxidoreductase [Myxococcota bacterium]
MIIIAGTIDLADASRRDEALQLAAVLQKKTREEEPGCHAYVFSADPCVSGRICVYELWQDEASLAAHFEHANYLKMRAALGRIGLKSADNSKYRVDLHEPVYDRTFTPRADFFTASHDGAGAMDDDRAIRNLVARYCHAIAERDDEAWLDAWAEDAEWVVLGRTLRGRAAILAHYRELLSGVRWAVQQATDGIVEVDGARGRGRWLVFEFLQGVRGGGGQNVARYRDDYVRCADGRWRFARRELLVTYLGPADLNDPERG